jgi:hypothetical protein
MTYYELYVGSQIFTGDYSSDREAWENLRIKFFQRMSKTYGSYDQNTVAFATLYKSFSTKVEILNEEAFIKEYNKKWTGSPIDDKGIIKSYIMPIIQGLVNNKYE